jgi:hypothetical protein
MKDEIKGALYFFALRRDDMGIDHCCFNIFMAKEFLYRSYILSIFEYWARNDKYVPISFSPISAGCFMLWKRMNLLIHNI